jgi:hypothetical protein
MKQVCEKLATKENETQQARNLSEIVVEADREEAIPMV